MNVVPEKPEQPRKFVWLGDSLDRLAGFPPAVRQKLGFALYQAQIGQKHESAKMLHGFAETVWQVSADDPRGTYRAVSVAQFGGGVSWFLISSRKDLHVLHYGRLYWY